MKTVFFLLAACGLQATHFQSSMTITEANGNEFIAELLIEKLSNKGLAPELVAAPRITCVKGQISKLTIESEDMADRIAMRIDFPDKNTVQATVLVQEKGQVVFDTKNIVKLKKE